MGFIIWLHLVSAALSSLIVSTILVVTQCRHSFRSIRQAFISHVKERNKASSANADSHRRTFQEEEGTFVIGFFHPHCGGGGGGERVLWKAIQALGELKEDAIQGTGNFRGDLRHVAQVRRNCRNLAVVVYTIDEPKETYERDIMKQLQDRFSITISSSLEVHFVHLHDQKHFLNKSKRLTMIAESWGTIRLAWCALNEITPHVFLDTTGCAFTYIVAKLLAGCKVGAYVHYPTISTDMLSLVWERRPTYNNKSEISSSPVVTYVKLMYYSVFAIFYGLVGSLADLVMVNSSWTKGHIQYLWRFARDVHVVFPPVDTESLVRLSLTDPPRENLILSIGQFRPEKDHELQLKAFALLIVMHDGEMKKSYPKLILVGSCRNEDDRERVDQLHKLARELKIEDSVKFVLNQPYSVLKDYLSRASVGIHTMWNEHFGIGVVEMMAAGLVTVAHNSGGPRSDIIQSVWDFKDFANNTGKIPTGCLAGTAEEYAHAIYEIIKRGDTSREVTEIRCCARRSAKRFSDQVFMKSFKETTLLSPLLK